LSRLDGSPYFLLLNNAYRAKIKKRQTLGLRDWAIAISNSGIYPENERQPPQTYVPSSEGTDYLKSYEHLLNKSLLMCMQCSHASAFTDETFRALSRGQFE